MNRELLEILKGMDLKAAETQLALHCAPLITRLKPSNLLIVPHRQAEEIQQLLQDTEIICFPLYYDAHRTALLLYRFQSLYQYLNGRQVRTALRQLGYRDFDFEKLLALFAGRYAEYMQGTADFPHEMGLFLGYPLEDVQGFIENSGKNFLYAGYWKVYQDAAQKARLFRRFDLARELLLRLA